MIEKATPDSVYEKVWKPLIEKGGDPDWQTVKELLFDYGALLSDTSILYSYLTEGQITNPQEPLTDVIEIADRLAAVEIDVGIRAVLHELLTELEQIPDDDPAYKLRALFNTINSIYEQGLTDDVPAEIAG